MAFAQSREVFAANPTADVLARLRVVYRSYPRIQESGIAAIEDRIDTARTEIALVRAQSDVLFFARCVQASICAADALAGLQERFTSAASALILESGIPVTFESNLLADWASSAGTALDTVLEQRVFRNTLANIAARDPRDTPSVLMADRLFRYLQREPGARDAALPVLEKVEWQSRDTEGPMREVYPELAAKRRRVLDQPTAATDGFGQTVEFDPRGVEFGPWIRNFIARVRRSWMIPPEAMSRRGHVSVSFDVQKNGAISDIAVARPCEVGAFNESSSKAIAASSPVLPLPRDYPEERAHFVVTFYYNESPPRK